jgi:hypothetical protein
MLASHKRRFLKRFVSGSCVASSLAAWPGPAVAYRPFDGTDAALAAPGEMEIELQPAGHLRDETGTSLIAPATVFNYGFSEGWEAVLEGLGQTRLSSSGPTSLTAAGAFLKHVLQPGSLQEKTGPSVATEFGVLLPDSTGASGVVPRVATMGLGHNPLECRDGSHPRASRRYISWRHYRGTIKMVCAAGCRVFRRTGIWPIQHGIRSGRSHLAGSR